MAPTEPAACSPVTARAISYSVFFIKQVLPHSRRVHPRMMAWCLPIRTSLPPFAAHHPVISQQGKKSAPAAPFLKREIDLLPNLGVIVALGKIAFDVYLSLLVDQNCIRSRSAFQFGHNREHHIANGLPILISCYHPSQQNTSTGRLTEKMLCSVFQRARRRLALCD